jgi:hypothetical protein
MMGMTPPAAMPSPRVVIHMRDHGPRVRIGAAVHEVRDRIVRAVRESVRVELDFTGVDSVGSAFLDATLGMLIARHGGDILRSIVFTHCSARVAGSIVGAFSQVPSLRPLLDFEEPARAS